MTFKKGDPKPPGSGRKKGEKSKKALQAAEILEKAGFCPIQALIDTHRLAMEGSEPNLTEAIRAANSLLPYVYPKLAAVDIQIGNEPGKVFEVNMLGWTPGADNSADFTSVIEPPEPAALTSGELEVMEAIAKGD